MKLRFILLPIFFVLISMGSASADSQNVELIGQELFWHNIHDIHVAGNYAYACSPDALVILNISRSGSRNSRPTVVGWISVRGDIRGIHVSGGYAYLVVWDEAESAGSLRIIDVSEPGAPIEMGVCPITRSAGGIYVVEKGDGQRYAYATTATDSPRLRQTGLQIMDVTDPRNPEPVGYYKRRVDFLLALPCKIHVVGDYVFVTGGDYGLYAINVSDPANPREAGRCGVFSIDLEYTSPDPEASGRQPPSMLTPRSQAILDSLYSGTISEDLRQEFADKGYPLSEHSIVQFESDSKLKIVDSENYQKYTISYKVVKENGKRLGRLNAYTFIADGVQVSGQYAYVNAWHDNVNDGSIWVIDVSEPDSPRELGICIIPRAGQGFQVAGNHVYIADGENGLRVVDVSKPTNPYEVGIHDTPGNASGVSIAGNRAYVADREAGIRIISVYNPGNMREEGSYCSARYAYNPYGNYEFYANGVCVDGDYAYVVTQWGLRVVSISNPRIPYEVGFYNENTTGFHNWQTSYRAVDISDGYAYVAAASNSAPGPSQFGSFRVIGISDPTTPGEPWKPSKDNFARGQDICVDGGYAYVADSYGILVLELSNPGSPKQVNRYHHTYDANSIHVVNGYAYSVCYFGFHVFDVSEPERPYNQEDEVGFCSIQGYPLGVYVSGDYAYVAAGGGGLRVISVHSPAEPREVGFYDTPGNANDVFVADGYAYIADEGAGLRVIDVSDPTNPREIGFYDDLNAKAVYVDGSYIYVASSYSGLFVLKYGGTPADEDITPPAAVDDLRITEVSESPMGLSVTLSWTAPGDDGDSGTAHVYDIRYSTFLMSDLLFDSSSAIRIPNEPIPAPAGEEQKCVVYGLPMSSDVGYYFALKTADEVPNWSGISNVVTLVDLEITYPTEEETYTSQVSPLEIRGTTSDNVVSVTWENITTGEKGNCSGTTDWSCRVSLKEGDNNIRITAKDAVGSEANERIIVSYHCGWDVGFNYMHETWTDPWDNVPKLNKSLSQRRRDFALMKELGATAVRIHGYTDQTFAAVRDAHEEGLRVWLSYRPNMRDFGIGQNDPQEENKHPDSPSENFCRSKSDLRILRETFRAKFNNFMSKAKTSLREGDCMIVANELPIDLGYRFDNETFRSEQDLLIELLDVARAFLGEDIALTYAALPPESEKIDNWQVLKELDTETGKIKLLDFISINYYWGSGHELARNVSLIYSATQLPVAITECGALTCPNAQELGGDGKTVNVNTLGDYYTGEEKQTQGIAELLEQIEYDPQTDSWQIQVPYTLPIANWPLPISYKVIVRGVFLFAWDEPMDTSFGLVRTGCIPWPFESESTKPQLDGWKWSKGAIFDIKTYVPIGKPALDIVARFFNLPQLGNAPRSDLSKVVLKTDTSSSSPWRVLLANYEPSKSSTETLIAKLVEYKDEPRIDFFPDDCTLLSHTLQTGEFDNGMVVWGTPGNKNQETESFLCVNDSSSYWLLALWEDAGHVDSTGWFCLSCDKVTGDSYVKLYNSDTNTVEITFRQPNTRKLMVAVFSPVDLSIIDPQGRLISKDANNIPNAEYLEEDIDGDEDIDDMIIILDASDGQYLVRVISEPDALPTDTYTLQISCGENEVVELKDVAIKDIPQNGYVFDTTTNQLTISTGLEEEPGLSIKPEKLSVQKDDTFTVNIEVNKITDLFGASFELQFNGDILEATGAKPGDALGGDVVFLNVPSKGKISVAISKKEGDEPFSGSGTLATIDFKAKADGKTEITFDKSKLTLQKADGTPIPGFSELTVATCEITVGQVSQAMISLEPSDVQVKPGDEFTLEAMVSHIDELFGASFEIQYDGNILEYVSSSAGDFMGSDVVFFSIKGDNTVNMAISMKAGAEPASGNGILAEIKFKARSAGESQVSYREDTLALNHPDGTPISVTVSNCSVTAGEGIIKGDVNNDGNVRSNDAILALRIASGLIEPTPEQRQAADMNGDGMVRSNDAILILREAAGLAAPGMNIPPTATRKATVTLPESHGVAGERLIVPLKVDNDDLLAGGDICITYDNTVLRALDVESNLMLVSNIKESGRVYISFAGVQGLREDTLADIQFDILRDSVSSLEFGTVELYQPDALPLASGRLNGRFSSWAIPPEYNDLMQNFPNPFNPETWIPYQLREGSEVTVRIHSITGELVCELKLGHKSAGLYITQDRAAYWDGKSDTGELVSSGVYFYTIQAGSFSSTRKMTVMR